MKRNRAIVWFRQDLRLTDNPALSFAVSEQYDVLPIYILDDENAGPWKQGGASRWWLHESLHSLNKSLGGKLQFYSGDARNVLDKLIGAHDIQAVFWNRCYEPWRSARDALIKDTLKSRGITAKSFNASLLWEPWDVLKADETPYKVFTPFYRKGCLGKPEPAAPLPAPKETQFIKVPETKLDSLRLLPDIKWYTEMAQIWSPGEDGAKARLHNFLKSGLKGYKEGRNRPDMEKVSRLSPHLHFGEISPRSVWHTARASGVADGLENDLDCFCSELGWREFSHSLLHFNPELPVKPLQQKFAGYPWMKDDKALSAWQRGRTGVPIVDAGMRQLWRTGWMHNRVRMIVGSFLVKNLRLHWQHGEEWFWDTLVDADLANNASSWQWIAGCGADAAPYFRIFNPVTQGEKFDPDGLYVREYVPELKTMPNDYIHKPWEAPAFILQAAGLKLDKDYPRPIVDLKKSREKALEGYQMIRGNAA